MTNNDIDNLQENQTCAAIGYQSVFVCVPVSVKPFAKTGKVTKRCDKPIVKSGKVACCGTKNGVCNFTIGQKIVVAVPVEFGAEATVGDAFVECLDASAIEACSESLYDLIDLEDLDQIGYDEQDLDLGENSDNRS